MADDDDALHVYTGWLIEKDDPPVYCIINPNDFDEHWTADASKAMRFARCEDAQAYSDIIGWTSPPVRVVEHMWSDGKVVTRQAPQVKHSDPHPHWKPIGEHERHPQTLDEWDCGKDPVGEHLNRAVRRLNMAMDRDDPRAPDQMAMVLRWDVSSLMHDWLHKNAYFETMRAKREAAIAAPKAARWRHKRRGTSYTEIGRASLQASDGVIGEGEILMIYRADADGTIWARPFNEFNDGRFEAVAPSAVEVMERAEIDHIRARMDYIEAHADAGGTGSPANLQELVEIVRKLLSERM